MGSIEVTEESVRVKIDTQTSYGGMEKSRESRLSELREMGL